MAKRNKRQNKKQSKKQSKNRRENYEIISLFIISFGILSILSLHTNSVGKFGFLLKSIFMGLLGKTSYVIPYIIIFYGIFSFNNELKKIKLKFVISSLTLFTCLIIIYTLINNKYLPDKIFNQTSFRTVYYLGQEGLGSGILGSFITYFFKYLFGIKGSYVVVATLVIISIMISTNLSIAEFFNFFTSSLKKLLKFIGQKLNDVKKEKEKKTKITISINGGSEKTIIDNSALSKEVDEKIKILDYTTINSDKQDLNKNEDKKKSIEVKATKISNSVGNNNENLKINTNDEGEYKLPDISLLNNNKNNNSEEEEKKALAKAKILEKTLNNFGVDAEVNHISKGPTITRFEIQPSPGVKVSKIVNLADDIALSLAAQNIRIEAPIPGKSAVGIEVPNDVSTIVTLREVIESDVYINSKSSLTFVLGKDISGSPIVADLAKMPHMLIAGATGSGKSVCVNTLITSILFKSSPDEVKFLLIDPKVVELSNYNGIPHLLMPVVTDPKKASTALNWAVQEMTNRYKLFAENNVRDLDSYNNKMIQLNKEKLPKIVVIIDELADLMMVAPNQVEDAICRLAQMARAAGIHLIVATQRPSVDVITGVIKANIPSRIAFAVSSQADSRTILDMGGAERLLGKGDMLFYPVGSAKPKRVQGAFVSDEEVQRVVDFIKSQVSDITYEDDILDNFEEISKSEEVDELLPEAIELVVNSQQASISMLQRKFRIGYNRAARIIDEMEKRGIVSESQGSKPRNVLISKEEFEEFKSKTS
ncbi:FtsK/SpoIIIE family DNA translocase [Caminicella sporogenes]|uniref:FtsK/SpoIIIE family DNA translocase n=1 Tax=Caminicella sporogenes TaxID=166485 RepID=UPI00253FDAF6|nr:DNA translocase FtsK [Caminicella sporogenes]WIF94693.1 DNA translocase FtsK [Caminicella sporogenes]